MSVNYQSLQFALDEGLVFYAKLIEKSTDNVVDVYILPKRSTELDLTNFLLCVDARNIGVPYTYEIRATDNADHNMGIVYDTEGNITGWGIDIQIVKPTQLHTNCLNYLRINLDNYTYNYNKIPKYEQVHSRYNFTTKKYADDPNCIFTEYKITKEDNIITEELSTKVPSGSIKDTLLRG